MAKGGWELQWSAFRGVIKEKEEKQDVEVRGLNKEGAQGSKR